MPQRRIPYRLETVRGTPIHVLGRTLVPVARVLSVTRPSATIHERGVEGGGLGVACVRPLRVVEVSGDQERVLPIQDLTARTIAAMALVAAAIALVSLVLIVTNRRTASGRGTDWEDKACH